jgi:hypothetical protein
MREFFKLAVQVLAITGFFVAFSSAQKFGSRGSDPTIHGVPPSVTSFGFGGQPGFHGVPPSVTSPNFGNVQSGTRPGRFGFGGDQRPRHDRRGAFVSPFYGGYYYSAYPYYVMDPGVDDSMQDEYARPGPTVFDSHGVAGGEYVRPVPRPDDDYRKDMNREAVEDRPQEPAPQQPIADEPATVLVFKDGHQQEVANYAIVGPMLYDLSDGRSKKVALAELDLSATVKQNDDRGVEFRLPGGVKN